MTVLAVAAPARTGRRFRPGVWGAALFLALIALAAVAPGLLVHGGPGDANALDALTGPSAAHPFGTDANGRDVLTRVVYGARPSLLAGLGATGLGVAAGSLLGLLAALGGRVADEVVMRFMDVVLSLPTLLLALLVLTITGPGTLNSIYAIALYTAPSYARLVRVQAMVIRRSGFVEAATSLGLTRARVISRHLLPNAFAPLFVLATMEVGLAIVAASSLSFLGLGPRPPAPEWGAMLSAGRDYFSVAWWTAVFPGLAITLTVLSVTVAGRRLQLRSEGRSA
ncbi:ABC transporter permease [Actinomadura rayongensis]|uniref:ABC transporter permease subunit n=1 Tax=Actinomadura rayongensis TaxID=1429076 RepID=A0A6I4WHD2_9ACTN|nr:ABC transporter permease [Actinomadura rayongensis]MXQ68280.1 ABC transporter permease subunit [Actinomadura rayongensis]